MEFVTRSERDGIATLTLGRDKVNAVNGRVVDELRAQLESAERDAGVRAVVLTGQGKFFSFGFDVPEFLPVSKDDFGQFVKGFTDLYTDMFVYPKPLVAAVNGHAIAGGCMLTLPCDHRVMVAGSAKIGLNEIAFGSSLFAGATEMLRVPGGQRQRHPHPLLRNHVPLGGSEELRSGRRGGGRRGGERRRDQGGGDAGEREPTGVRGHEVAPAQLGGGADAAARGRVNQGVPRHLVLARCAREPRSDQDPLVPSWVGCLSP